MGEIYISTFFPVIFLSLPIIFLLVFHNITITFPSCHIFVIYYYSSFLSQWVRLKTLYFSFCQIQPHLKKTLSKSSFFRAAIQLWEQRRRNGWKDVEIEERWKNVKIISVQEKVWYKKIFWYKINFDKEDIVVQEKVWYTKIFWYKKKFDTKRYFGKRKSQIQKDILVQEVWRQKIDTMHLILTINIFYLTDRFLFLTIHITKITEPQLSRRWTYFEQMSVFGLVFITWNDKHTFFWYCKLFRIFGFGISHFGS